MGWFFRKSVNVGPVRLNFSKSGVGVSAGVKGARVSVGPKGTYVSVGRGGIYYRQKIGGTSQNNKGTYNYPQVENAHQLEEIKTAEVEKLVESKFQSLLSEINEKTAKPELTIIYVWVLIIGFLALCINLSLPMTLIIMFPLSLGLIPLKKLDKKNKTINLNYELDYEISEKYSALNQALKSLQNCNKVWRIVANGAINDWKRNAGAGNLVNRTSASVINYAPKFMEVNIEVFQISYSGQKICFLPDTILIYQGKNVGAISYENFHVMIGSTRFIEDGVVPRDSKNVGSTWKYVNKNGTPDRRFSNNKQLPILLYGEMWLKSTTGLNLCFQTSNSNIPELIRIAISNMGEFMKNLSN